MSEIILTDPKQIFQILENCPDGATIKFQPLEKEVHIDPFGFQCLENYYYISNNRHGLKRVPFPIIGKKNITFDGGGSNFIFHGEIMPFVHPPPTRAVPTGRAIVPGDRKSKRQLLGRDPVKVQLIQLA